MTTPMITQKQNPLTKTIAVGVLTLGIMSFATPAYAAKREENALIAALGKPIANATPSELVTAVNAVQASNPKWKLGVIIGEALRGATAPNAGAALGALSADPAVVGLAIKTAGSGKTANVENVPDYVEAIDAIDTEAEIFAVAKVAKASKAGVGAALQGYAVGNGVNTDAALAALSNNAVVTGKFGAAIQQIAQYVGAVAPAPETFASLLSGSQTKSLVKIATGVTASNPTDAGAIVGQLLATPAVSATAIKQVSNLAKSVAAVADIEQISIIASGIGAQIGTNAIKVTKANALVKTLTKAIASKPDTATANDTNSARNKLDEVAEVAAYFVNGIAGSTGITDKNAGKVVLNIIKNAINGAKVPAKRAGTNPALADLVTDVTASVVRTIIQSPGWDNFEATVLAFLNSKANTVAGKANAAAVLAAITAGQDTGDNRFEDGTIPGNLVPDNLPESDFRPYPSV